MVKIVIKGQLTTLNDYTNANRNNRYGGGAVKKRETTRCARAITKYLLDNPQDEELFPANIRFDWYRKDKRSDKDNIAFAKKFILDGFMQAELLDNDNWVNILDFEDHFYIDKDNPRVEITLTPPK